MKLSHKIIRKTSKILLLFAPPVCAFFILYVEKFDAIARIADQGNSALQNLLNRSPGNRSSVDTIKGKAGDAAGAFVNPDGATALVGPTERALGKIFDTPASSPDALTVPLGSAAQSGSVAVPVGDSSVLSSPGEASGIGLPAGGEAIPVFSNAAGIGPVAGGISTPPVQGVVVPVATIPSAVPEPSTWSMMLMGFGLLGALLRRTKKRALIAQN